MNDDRRKWPRPPVGRTAEDNHICLWLEYAEYLVILAERKGYILLWTAYAVEQEHSKKKLRNEYAAAINS